jgi:hypothetical protein
MNEVKKKEVLTIKNALRKMRVSNKKKHIIRKDGDIPFNEVTIPQLNQKKFFSDVTKAYYKMASIQPTTVKVKYGRDRIHFTTPSFETKKKEYQQVIMFPKNLTQIKDKKEFNKLDVLVDCNCEGFQMQGMRYKLGTVGAALKKEKRKDDVWGPRHNNKNYLCKHLKYVIKNFDSIVKNT